MSLITRTWERLDRFAFPLTIVILLAATSLANPSLREFSSLVSAICLMGLLWRVIGTYHQMTRLSFALAVSTSINLAAAGIAQYLLAHPVRNTGSSPPPPDNTFGLILVLLARSVTLAVIIVWPYLLTHSHRRVQ